MGRPDWGCSKEWAISQSGRAKCPSEETPQPSGVRRPGSEKSTKKHLGEYHVQRVASIRGEAVCNNERPVYRPDGNDLRSKGERSCFIKVEALEIRQRNQSKIQAINAEEWYSSKSCKSTPSSSLKRHKNLWRKREYLQFQIKRVAKKQSAKKWALD